MTKRTNAWADLRVGSKLNFIPLFFILALIAIVIFTVSTQRQQEVSIIVQELIGRQRMLGQAHFVQVLLAAQGAPGTAERMAYLRKVWTETQHSLVHGGPAPRRLDSSEQFTLEPPPTAELLELQKQQAKMITENVRDTDLYLQATPGSEEAAALLGRIRENLAMLQDLGVSRAYSIYMVDRSRNLIRFEIGLAVVVGLLGLLLSWTIARGIVNPLRRVVDVADSVSKGDLRIEKLRLGTSDEIGRLADAFDNMVDNLKDLSGQILSVTGNVNSAAAEILASTQQQASSTKEQAATVQEISTTMQEISQSGVEISEKAKQVAATAEATSSAGQSGIAAVQGASLSMEGIRQQVEDVATKIVSLSERAQAIGEIVSTVNDIADQTNLLALNASIEAASAGEHGNRFSVVAAEMRSLAERAKESTVQVGAILGEIQRGINSTVMLTEEAVKRSESGRQQASLTEQTIQQMTRTTVDSVNAFQQIIGATSQQQIGFDQVTQGMRDIRQAAEQTAVGTSQLEKALANLNDLSQQLREAVSRYRI